MGAAGPGSVAPRVWAGVEVRETGGGVAATRSVESTGSEASPLNRSANAASASSIEAPNPDGAALAPAWPVEVRRAAALVWIPNIITRD
jgi:hypothetical protein